MNIGFLISIVVLSVLSWLWWHTRQARSKAVNLSRSQVAAALENLISVEPCLHDEFDMFISRPIVDPYLESVRQRALEIAKRNPGNNRQDISDKGAQEIERLLSEFREST